MLTGEPVSDSAPRSGTTFPVFYGWVIVVFGALAMLATLPGRTHGLGLITERLLQDSDLHLNRLQFGTLNFWATILGAAFCLPCGKLLDRYGTRLTLTVITALLGLVVLAMTHLTDIGAICFKILQTVGWEPKTTSFVDQASFWSFFIAILLTRGLGQSALSVVSLAMVGKWFSRRLGLAMSVYTILVAVAFIAAFSVAREYRDVPWQTLWSGLGFALLFVFTPLNWICVRDTPEESGLKVDGGVHVAGEPTASATGATFAAALAKPAFWVFALATSVYGLVSSGISLFNEDILIERGFTKETYYTLLKITTGLGLAGNFLGGWLMHRTSLRTVMGLSILLLASSLCWMPQVSTFPQLIGYAVGMSVGGGMMTVVFFTAFGQVFGRRHLGQIQGIAQMLTVFASALGPVSLAYTKDYCGTYTPFFYAATVIVLSLGVWASVVRIPAAAEFQTPET